MADTAAQFTSWQQHTGSQYAATKSEYKPQSQLLALLKQAHAQALDPQNYPPGAATATLDEAMEMVEGKQ